MRSPRPPFGRRIRGSRAVVRGGAPGTRVDPRGRLVDGRVPGRDTVEGSPRCGRARPDRDPAEPGRPQRVGEQPRARDGRRHGGHARSGRRPDRARPGRRAERHPPRRCRRPGGRPGARPDARGRRRGTARGAAVPALPGDHGLAGRHRDHGDVDGQLLRLPPSGRERRSHRARRRRPVVGSRSRCGAGRRTGRAPRRRPRRALRRDEREDHAGRRVRDVHGRGAGALPRRRRQRHGSSGGSPSSIRRPSKAS